MSSQFRQQTYFSRESAKTGPLQFVQNPHGDHLERPMTALAQHRPHELSEIREVSGSSKATLFRRHSLSYVDGTGGAVELEARAINSDNQELPDTAINLRRVNPRDHSFIRSASPRSDLRSLAPSALSLPVDEIPQRKSSISAISQTYPGSLHPSLQDLHSESIRLPHTIRAKGLSNSPVRHALAKGAISSEALPASPSRTLVRTTTPFYLLDDQNRRNPRLEMSVRLPSPLFVGGGTVEGQVEIRIDATSNKKTRLKSLLISRLSVDIIGVEEVDDGRRRIFLSLATELFDSRHPPPSTLVTSQTPEKGSELFWQTQPGNATIPFCINLPLKLGPPPYSSRQASIRYLLCPSAVIKTGEKRSAVRQAWTIQMLSVYDPEKALASLPDPLIASDILTLAYTPVVQSVKLTSGLHRQTWVSGGVIFTDVHIVNSTDKVLKKIELHLEKSTLWFSHSAAGTVEKRANNLRLPNKIETEVVSKSTIKKSKEWEGVAAQSSELRTCELEVPKSHVTVGDGRYFEVRYYVKITVTVTKNKPVSVQLPVTIIHMNSLDIMPNSVAQVAASIEAKRTMAMGAIGNSIARIPHSQGQAFTAARRQSSERAKRIADGLAAGDMSLLMQDLDDSPRRVLCSETAASKTALKARTGVVNENVQPGVRSCYQHLTLRPSCYHCHLLYTEHATKLSSNAGPKLPRLQVSTSGLGFSESEFEIPPDSPRKVMLSEQERQMINHQRELGLQRQLSQQKSRNAGLGIHGGRNGVGFSGFKNVALGADVTRAQTTTLGDSRRSVKRQPSQRRSMGMPPNRNSVPPPIAGRSRSKTNPEKMRDSFSDGSQVGMRFDRPSRSMRSIDRTDHRIYSGYNLAENDVFGPLETNRYGSKHTKAKRSVQAQPI